VVSVQGVIDPFAGTGFSVPASLPRYAKPVIHALSVLKNACLEALEEGDMGQFLFLADPTSVLE